MLKSPLRYPGGKSKGAAQIMHYFPRYLQEMVSPFIGGGSIELQAAESGIRVYGSDAFPTLVDFWQELLSDPVSLHKAVLNFHPMPAEQYKELQRTFLETQWLSESQLEKAARYYAINRTSFSGIGLFGAGMSPKTERFTRKHIDYLAEFKAPQLSVELSDFQKALKHRPSVFAYCDPPYFLDGKCLYGKQHLDFNHEALHRILRKRKAWLLSYDDCPEVRELYSGFRIKTVSWCYGMANQNEGFDGTSKEVLILSDDIIEPQELQPSLF